MILQWQNNNPNLTLQWQQNNSEFKFEWRIPGSISTEWVVRNFKNVEALNSLGLLETRIAVVTGPQGPQGNQGEPGEMGPPGTDLTLSWSPPSAQATWVINHSLGKHPSVSVVDSTGRQVIPEITYLSTNLVEVSFAFATSGTAYLN